MSGQPSTSGFGTHLRIGSLPFDGLHQIDLSGPFEVLSRIPDSTYRIYGLWSASVRDVRVQVPKTRATWTDAL